MQTVRHRVNVVAQAAELLADVMHDARAVGFCDLVANRTPGDDIAFVRLLTDFMRTTEPARVDAGRWTELLRSGGDSAAVPLRRPAKRAARRRSTG